jgi:hypothetical protein
MISHPTIHLIKGAQIKPDVCAFSCACGYVEGFYSDPFYRVIDKRGIEYQAVCLGCSIKLVNRGIALVRYEADVPTLVLL